MLCIRESRWAAIQEWKLGSLEGIEVRLHTDYLQDKEAFDRLAGHVIYTGPIDAYFHYCLGPLAYRNVRFETKVFGYS